METTIQMLDLTKSFTGVEAVKDLNITIGKGEIYGFLGLNGAGKTTTIRMLLGLVKPDSGKVYIKGKRITQSSKSIWNEVGSLVELPHAYPNLTVAENLNIVCTWRGVDRNKRIPEVLDRFKLKTYEKRPFKALSLGNKQRLGLAMAMVHNPSVLILDEPTNGLDPEGKYTIRKLLVEMAENSGVTILISSHILREVSLFATRIGIIHSGRLIHELDNAQLKGLLASKLKIICNEPELAIKLLQSQSFDDVKFFNEALYLQNAYALKKPHIIAKLLFDNDIEISEIRAIEEDLESYFLNTIQKANIN